MEGKNSVKVILWFLGVEKNVPVL